jgi:hypothetical protein
MLVATAYIQDHIAVKIHIAVNMHTLSEKRKSKQGWLICILGLTG